MAELDPVWGDQLFIRRAMSTERATPYVWVIEFTGWVTVDNSDLPEQLLQWKNEGHEHLWLHSHTSLMAVTPYLNEAAVFAKEAAAELIAKGASVQGWTSPERLGGTAEVTIMPWCEAMGTDRFNLYTAMKWHEFPKPSEVEHDYKRVLN